MEDKEEEEGDSVKTNRANHRSVLLRASVFNHAILFVVVREREREREAQHKWKMVVPCDD